MSADSMRRFWDRRAREDAMFYVDNRIGFANPDAEARFWAGGRSDLDAVLGELLIEIEPRQVVVEIGCGVGRLTRPIAERAASVAALDVSPEMLARAEDANPHLDNVQWLLGDGTSLEPVGDESADLCISHVVFQHIPDPGVTLGYVREMGRVLRPGGVAGFQISNAPHLHLERASQPLARRVRGWLGRGPRGQTHPAWIGSAVDLDDLREAAADARLEVERVRGEGTQYCFVRARKSRSRGTG